MTTHIKHVNLVRHLAWSFSRTTRIDWKELFSEACLAYCEALEGYDPNKSAETTWIYNCVRGALITFCKKEMSSKYIEGVEYWFSIVTPPPDVEFPEEPRMLSHDTKEIIDMVLAYPEKYQCVPKQAIGRIRNDLRQEKKWTWPHIEEAMRNLRKDLI